jgi:transposase
VPQVVGTPAERGPELGLREGGLPRVGPDGTVGGVLDNPTPGGLEDPPVDGGYTGRLVEWAKEKLALVVKAVKRSDDVSGFVVLPRRWVVERTLRWLMRSRRLARDYERLPETGETFILWSVTMVMSRCLARHYSREVAPF